MFPLGSVLLPHGLLSLHVFEPRYRQLVRDCLDGDGRFGVVLIERGSEVGGGDVRFDTGTVARIVDAAPLSGGRWALACAGIERIDVLRWLADDPYPVAEAEVRPERADQPTRYELEAVRRLVVSCAAMRAELGEPAPAAVFALAPDSAVAVWQLCVRASLGPLDALRLLRVDSPSERLAELAEMLAEERAVLARRLSGGQE